MPKKAAKIQSHSNECRIKAVIFDLGNVLFRLDSKRFLRACSSCSIYKEREILEKLSGISLFRLYEHGFVSSRNFYQSLCRLLQLRLSYDEFATSFGSYLIPMPQNLELVSRLKEQYWIGCISNTNEMHYQYLVSRYAINNLFHYLSLSYRLGCMKPSYKIYEDCLSRLKLSAGDCLYIDDIQAHVNAARSLRFQALLYSSHDSLLEDLKRFSVL